MMFLDTWKLLCWATTLGALAVSQRTALWVPDCGDHVLMLGDYIANEFQALNALSVTDIDTVLAFQTYTVLGESMAPAGFQYSGDYLVKDTPPTHTVTTCTTAASDTCIDAGRTLLGSTSGATSDSTSGSTPSSTPGSTPESTPGSTSGSTPGSTSGSTSGSTHAGTTQVTNTPASVSSEAVAPTSCFTAGPGETENLFMYSRIAEFCRAHTSLASPTSVSTAVSATVSGSEVEVVFEVSEAECNFGRGAARHIPISFAIPSGPKPTDQWQKDNQAMLPCLEFINMWLYCKDEVDNGGRGGYGTVGCLQFNLQLR